MKPSDPRYSVYLARTKGKLLAISFITVGELLFGAIKKKWGAQKLADLNERIRRVAVVPYDQKLCETYGDLKAKLRDKGKTVADNDLWIASCAVRHAVPLVSHNRAHFEGIPGLVLISEAPVIAQIQSQGTLPGIVPTKTP